MGTAALTARAVRARAAREASLGEQAARLRSSGGHRMAAPVSVERFVKELEALKAEMDAGKLAHGEYDRRLARALGELRERGLDADRGRVTPAIDDAAKRGIITPAGGDPPVKRLGACEGSGAVGGGPPRS